MVDHDELAEKERRVRQLLSSKGLKALFLKRQANFSWMTCGGLNLVGIATEVGAASLLITDTAKYLVANNIESPRMIHEEGLEKLGFSVQTYPWQEDREAAIVRELTEGGPLGSDIPFPNAVVMPEEIAGLRYSLTPAEVVRYRWLGAKTAAAVEKTLSEARPGEKESEVVGRLSQELWKDRIDPVGLMAAADDRIERYRHPIPTEQRSKRFLMLSVNARKGGLIVCLTRFVYFGKAPQALRERYEANVFVDCTFMVHTRPGALARDVFQEGLDAYRERGFPDEWKLHHQGGSIGYQNRDYRVDPGTREVIQENQGFCWNPSLTGTKSEDTILATTQGPEMITGPIAYPTLKMEVGGTPFIRPAILEKS